MILLYNFLYKTTIHFVSETCENVVFFSDWSNSDSQDILILAWISYKIPDYDNNQPDYAYALYYFIL